MEAGLADVWRKYRLLSQGLPSPVRRAEHAHLRTGSRQVSPCAGLFVHGAAHGQLEEQWCPRRPSHAGIAPGRNRPPLRPGNPGCPTPRLASPGHPQWVTDFGSSLRAKNRCAQRCGSLPALAPAAAAGKGIQNISVHIHAHRGAHTYIDTQTHMCVCTGTYLCVYTCTCINSEGTYTCIRVCLYVRSTYMHARRSSPCLCQLVPVPVPDSPRLGSSRCTSRKTQMALEHNHGREASARWYTFARAVIS